MKRPFENYEMYIILYMFKTILALTKEKFSLPQNQINIRSNELQPIHLLELEILRQPNDAHLNRCTFLILVNDRISLQKRNGISLSKHVITC